jgi:ubiquinone/menaquinone biosynthesis C-methylase UbiE
MLERARAAAAASGVAPDALSLVQLDARAPLPFASGSFEIAVAADLLVHLPDPTAALRELRRVLAPGGRAIIDTTNRHPQWMLRYPGYAGRRPGRWLRTWRAGGVLPGWTGIVTHHSRGEFRRMIADAGLLIVEERAYGPRPVPTWMLAVCERPLADGAPPVPVTAAERT